MNFHRLGGITRLDSASIVNAINFDSTIIEARLIIFETKLYFTLIVFDLFMIIIAEIISIGGSYGRCWGMSLRPDSDKLVP